MKNLLLTTIASTLFSGSVLAAGTLLCNSPVEPGTTIRINPNARTAELYRAGKPPRFISNCQINPSSNVYVLCIDNSTGQTIMIRPDLSGCRDGMSHGELSCRATYE